MYKRQDYGYITLEAFFSEKPVIVHKDAGGPLEFVEHEKNGYILEADAQRVAEKIDELYTNRKKAELLGKADDVLWMKSIWIGTCLLYTSRCV